MNFSRFKHLYFQIAFGVFGLILDQWTKLWAVSYFSGSDRNKIIPFLGPNGDWLRFRLVYNEGAAFSLRPQDLMPFLPSWLFYLLISVVAMGVLIWFFKSIDKRDWLSRLGVIMIISGALGNFVDRMRIGKVVDFIDCDFPDFIMTRFPVFNVADSYVTIGLVLIFISPILLKRTHSLIKKEKELKNAIH
ncbi:MAG: signal peptidase II [Fibrobacter sp.]|nr:signal peptidase II [Fibrobacter sp.]